MLLRILQVEDSVADADLALTTLLAGGIPCRGFRVDTQADYLLALEEGDFDLILSDVSLPEFSGNLALKMARERCPNKPFIFVSGTIGEESAIDSLLNGATDYVLKQRYARLVPAVQRALRETEERHLRVETQAQLAAASYQLHNLFDNLDDAFLSIDLNRPELSRISPACERISGWTAADLLERPGLLKDCVLEADRQTLSRALVELKKGHVVRDQCRIAHRSGGERWLEFQVKAVFGKDKNMTRIDGVVRDITDQRTIERQLLRSQRLESVGTLASGIAHDLNNVLTPILAAVQLLLDRTTDDQSTHLLNTLDFSARRGAELIKQVLAYGRGIEEHRGPVRLAQVFTDITKILGETLPRSIRTYKEVPEDLWYVRGDSTQLRQLLLNLCVNARDAMPEGGYLSILAKNTMVHQQREVGGLRLTPGPYVMFEVRDTGPGMAKPVLERIFEPFFTTKPDGDGTGLGLFTVKAIVRSHRGLIEVESEPGAGTVFTVFLPIAEGVPPAEVATDRDIIPRGKGQLVLLVDDEASVRDILGATLEAYGYRVITAENGAEGLCLFHERREDVYLILSDMNMPVMNGENMIKEIRKIAPEIRIVMASGLGHEHGAQPPAPLRSRTVQLQKPFTARELLQAIQRVAEA